MATGKRYYWLKLKESFMTSDTIDYFMSQPNGASYVVLYQMLCLKTINTDGRLSRKIGEFIIPYDIPKIQRDLKWFSADTIRVALNLYKSFGLLYEDVDGVLRLADHNNLVGSETDWSAQKRRQATSKSAQALPSYPYVIGKCTVVSNEQLVDEDGKQHFVDEKRYGGNGKLVLANFNCKCQMCGSKENVVIHHNNGYSNDIQDLVVLCKSCHGKVESGVEIFHSNFHTDIEIENRDKEIDINSLNIRDKEKYSNKKKADAFSEFAGDNFDLLSALTDFEKMRKSIKKPMTDRAKSMLVNKLAKDFPPHLWIPVLEQSISHCWADVYELKDNFAPQRHTAMDDLRELHAAYASEEDG